MDGLAQRQEAFDWRYIEGPGVMSEHRPGAPSNPARVQEKSGERRRLGSADSASPAIVGRWSASVRAANELLKTETAPRGETQHQERVLHREATGFICWWLKGVYNSPVKSLDLSEM